MQEGKADIQDIPAEFRTPLDYAVTRQADDIPATVEAALRHDETMLAFQPVYPVSGGETPVLYEGLSRILDPAGREIVAREYISLLSRTTTEREIDVASLRIGFKALRLVPKLHLSINMSARSIGYGRWANMLMHELKATPGLGRRLVLELGETSVTDLPELVSDLMRAARPFGVRFALDDFGAGPMALRRLRDFTFDIFKIDGQFVRGLATREDNRRLVRSLISIAEEFGGTTIAQSVENHQDAKLLRKMGVPYAQGYYYCAPTLFPEWLPASINQAGRRRR